MPCLIEIFAPAIVRDSIYLSFPFDLSHPIPHLQGIYLITFVNCIKSLVWIDGGFKPFHKLHIKMLVAAFLMLIFATLDVAFHLRHNLEIFVGAPNPEYVIAAFNHTSYWLNVMKMASYVAQTFVGDSILVSLGYGSDSPNLTIPGAFLALPMLDHLQPEMACYRSTDCVMAGVHRYSCGVSPLCDVWY